VPLRSDPLNELTIPSGTTVEEHDLVTDGDVIVGGQSTVEFGVRGHNVMAGERVRFGGDIEAEGDCRLDMWSDVAGNVLVGRDAYLGERVHVGGQLMVSGDLDIGDDVDIEDGFEANGWIVIRNPMPTIVFLFVYLSQLLRIGEEDKAEDVVAEFLESDHDNDPVLIPRSSQVSDDAWRVSTPATVGDDCRLHGNIRAASITVGTDTEIFGSLRAREDINVSAGTVIHGDVTTRSGTVRVAADATVRGDVSADDVMLHDDAVVEGSIRARGEMTLLSDDSPLVDTDTTTDESDAAVAGDSTDTHAGDATTDDEPDDTAETAADESMDTDEPVATDDDADPDEQVDADEADDDEDAVDDADTDEPLDTDEPAGAAQSDDDPASVMDDPVARDTERVTATDGSDPDDGDDYRENGHEEPTEVVE
jgi:predicted acyltransferase (DUF342 family)